MYYSIENSTGKDVGHVFPQASCLNQDLAHSIQFDQFSNFDCEILFKLEPKANLTDVLSQAAISAYGFLISKKTRRIFETFNLMQHRYYKCLVKDQKGLVHDYYWLHLLNNDLFNKIDYAASRFYTTEFGFRNEDVILESYEDYKIRKAELGTMYGFKADSIQLTSEFDYRIDMFNIPIFGKSTYISKVLADTLTNNNITGISINTSNIIN